MKKYLWDNEKGSNFATAIGKRGGTAMKARPSEDGCKKIENNDMMPQDKQRQPKGWRMQETREHEANSGFPVKKIPS